MIKKLIEQMKKEAEQMTKKHETSFINSDTQIDIESLENKILSKEGDIFYWIIRNAGTQLIDKNELSIKNTHNYNSCNYFLTGNNWRDCFKVFEINIKNLTIKKSNKEALEKTHNNAIEKTILVNCYYKIYTELKFKQIETNTFYNSKALNYAKWELENNYGINENNIIELKVE